MELHRLESGELRASLPANFSFKITSSPGEGRALVSTREIKHNQTVLTDSAILLGPASGNVCINCCRQQTSVDRLAVIVTTLLEDISLDAAKRMELGETDGEILVMQLETQRTVKPGTQLTIRYSDYTQGHLQRQKFLREQWYFWCHCPRCSDPTEFGTRTSGLPCTKQDCAGLFLPKELPVKSFQLSLTSSQESLDSSKEPVTSSNESMSPVSSSNERVTSSCEQATSSNESSVEVSSRAIVKSPSKTVASSEESMASSEEPVWFCTVCGCAEAESLVEKRELEILQMARTVPRPYNITRKLLS